MFQDDSHLYYELRKLRQQAFREYRSSMDEWKGTIYMDPKTMSLTKSNKNIARDLNLHKGKLLWDGFELVFNYVQKNFREVGSAEVISTEIVYDSVCLYVELKKSNGRTVYVDHPFCSKEYL